MKYIDTKTEKIIRDEELNARISKRQNCTARPRTKIREVRHMNTPDKPKITVLHQRWNPTFPYFVEEWGRGITEEEFNELLTYTKTDK